MHVSAIVDILPRHRVLIFGGGGGGGYVLSGHCSGQQISVNNEGYLFSEGYLFTGFYGSLHSRSVTFNSTAGPTQ